MQHRYEITGTFVIDVDAEDHRQAKEKAQRILHDSGIAGYVVDTQKKEDNKC